MVDEKALRAWLGNLKHSKGLNHDGIIKTSQPLTIEVVTENQSSVRRWTYLPSWPVKFNSADLNAEGNEVAIEQLELANEGIELVSSGDDSSDGSNETDSTP